MLGPRLPSVHLCGHLPSREGTADCAEDPVNVASWLSASEAQRIARQSLGKLPLPGRVRRWPVASSQLCCVGNRIPSRAV